ncbi:MAG: putative transposase [Verrucomicrobiales bacterium]|jgi:putative transposase
MPQSLSQIYVHIVFSTKDRYPFLQDPEIRGRLFAYLSGTCRNLDSPSIRIGGVSDHIHILCRQSKNHSMSDIVRELKRESSKWVKEQSPNLTKFYWQSGYGAFSISPGHVEALTKYISDQEEHHRKETFQDEFRRLCRKYGVELDERYVWD